MPSISIFGSVCIFGEILMNLALSVELFKQGIYEPAACRSPLGFQESLVCSNKGIVEEPKDLFSRE